jgi:protein tyrosine/serine phosphatase
MLFVRWTLGTLIALAIVGLPTLYWRVNYFNERRFREVTPGKCYRCGQMTADGFREKLRTYGIKLVINLQDEYPDPLLPKNFWDKPNIRESQVCAEENVRYKFISWYAERGLLPRNQASATNRPAVIDEFLAICDEAHQKNEPILVHCAAGLHRTGALIAVYRMEYEGWSVADAMRELRAVGYGDRKATLANDYIYEYLYLYQPRAKRPGAASAPK